MIIYKIIIKINNRLYIIYLFINNINIFIFIIYKIYCSMFSLLKIMNHI